MFLPKVIGEENNKDDFVSKFSENLNNINIRALIKNVTDNTNKHTSINMHTSTYNALRFQNVSSLCRSSSRSLHLTSINKTEMNYQID
jgi:hypothetical protein